MTAQQAVEALTGLQPAAILLVIARISPLFLLAPLFSSSMIPRRVRGIVAVGLAVGIAPVALAGGRVPTAPLPFAELLVKELLVGLAFALALAALLAGLQAAGTLIDLQIGFAFGALVDPLTGTQGAVVSQLYTLLGVAILVAIGGDQYIVQGLARTYDLVPLNAFPELRTMVAGSFRAFSQILVAALEVGAPVLLALVLTDAAFGMVSRVVPQMNVFAVGFPAKVVVGLLLTIATLPFAAGWFGDRLTESVAAALQTLRVAS